MQKKEHNLGQESSFTVLPSTINLNNESYFLIKKDEQYQLLSTRCPHAGGTVLDYGTEFVCPLHYWSFNKESGACTHYPNMGLETTEVIVRDGCLYAELS